MSANMLGLIAWLLAILGALLCALGGQEGIELLSLVGGGTVAAALYCAFASGRRE